MPGKTNIDFGGSNSASIENEGGDPNADGGPPGPPGPEPANASPVSPGGPEVRLKAILLGSQNKI